MTDTADANANGTDADDADSTDADSTGTDSTNADSTNADSTNADADDADCDSTDATNCADAPKSRKRQPRDPIEKALKSLRIGKSPGFLSLLGLLFIGLKLTGHIDWSWWWVLAPILIKGPIWIVVIVAVIYYLKNYTVKKTGRKPSADT